MTMESKKTSKLLKFLYTILGIIGVYLIFKYTLAWFMPFIIAFIIARLLQPVINKITDKIKLSRHVVSAFCVLLVYSILGIVLYFILSRIIAEIIDFVKLLPSYINMMPELLETFRIELSEFLTILPAGIAATVLETYDNLLGNIEIPASYIQQLVTKATNFAFSLPSALIFIITMLVSTYFISSDYKTITKFVMFQFSEKWRERFYRTKEHLVNTLGKWLKAMLIIISITFVELTIGLLILKIDYAILVAFLIALIDALPVLGVGTILIPWALYELFTGNYYMAAFIIVMYVIISIVRNVVEPKIVGSQIGLPPLVTLVCIYIGYKTIGLAGMFLFPIIAITLMKFQEWGYIRIFKTSELTDML